MTIQEKIQAREIQRKHDNSLDRALFRAGGIIIAGYLIGTLIGWLIVR